MSYNDKKTFDAKVKRLFKKHERLTERKNEPVEEDHGIYNRYKYPILTRDHIPIPWRFDLNYNTNPYF